MQQALWKQKIISAVEIVTVTALQALVVLLVIGATIVLYVLFVNNLFTETSRIESIPTLFSAMQNSFAGVLIVVLGLELLETLKIYFVEHQVRLEVILVVAIIAVSRHVIQTDFGHTPATVLIGMSSVILALTVGYYLVKKT